MIESTQEQQEPSSPAVNSAKEKDLKFAATFSLSPDEVIIQRKEPRKPFLSKKRFSRGKYLNFFAI